MDLYQLLTKKKTPRTRPQEKRVLLIDYEGPHSSNSPTWKIIG